MSSLRYDFSDEEEIKKYIQNIGTEYHFGCFSEKKPEVCHVLGEWFDLISNNIEKAAQIFKMNCDDYNYPRSCEAYGNYILRNKVKEVPKYEIAFKYLTKACDNNISPACYNAGIIAFKGMSKANYKKNYKESIRLMDKACDLKYIHGCFFLSELYIKGTKDQEVEKNMKNAFNYSSKACDLGHPKACFNISVMYERGEGVEKNLKLSEEYDNRGKKIRNFYFKS